MILIGFPTKYEAEDFIKILEGVSHETMEGVECYAGKIKEAEVLVAILGIGAVHSAKRIGALVTKYQFSIVVIAGFAGALIPELKHGRILVASGYTTEDTINYIKILPGFDIASLYTSPTLISTAAEKAQLARQTGCQFVDMETAAIAPVVKAVGLDMLAVRVISDTADQDLPGDLLASGYDYATAKETPVKMAFRLIFNPGKIGKLKSFLAPLPEARKKLTDFLSVLIPDLP